MFAVAIGRYGVLDACKAQQASKNPYLPGSGKKTRRPPHNAAKTAL
jgi:hypothetical protein